MRFEQSAFEIDPVEALSGRLIEQAARAEFMQQKSFR
jgi:hypothetical protein